MPTMSQRREGLVKASERGDQVADNALRYIEWLEAKIQRLQRELVKEKQRSDLR